MTYFNTTHEAGAELAEAVNAAKAQDAVVLGLFRASGEPLSPSAVWRCCLAVGHHWPLTSVRRAITTLTERALLVRTDCKVVGHYGRREHQWQAVA